MALDSPITCNPLYTGGCLQGEWCQWERWDSCSTTCGPGLEQWGRRCECPHPGPGGRYCPGLGSKREACNIQQCPGLCFAITMEHVPSGFWICNRKAKGICYTWELGCNEGYLRVDCILACIELAGWYYQVNCNHM